MGIINTIKDRLTNEEFFIYPDKKLKMLSADFKKTFGCTLVFYKGSMIADSEMTLKELDKHTTKDVTKGYALLKIKGSTKVGDAEKMFNDAFGVTIQIKDKAGKECVPNNITIGQAARGEY